MKFHMSLVKEKKKIHMSIKNKVWKCLGDFSNITFDKKLLNNTTSYINCNLIEWVQGAMRPGSYIYEDSNFDTFLFNFFFLCQANSKQSSIERYSAICFFIYSRKSCVCVLSNLILL